MIVISTLTLGQYTQVGDGGFSSTVFTPFQSSTNAAFYSRNAFIYPSGSMNNLRHGDSITALEFKYQIGDTLTGPCNLKIYIKSTDQPDFGTGSLNWAAESRNGMTLVYDGDPRTTMNDGDGNATFVFNEVNAYRFDTIGNRNNLEILIQYSQNTNQSSTIPFYNEFGTTVPAFISSHESKYLSGSSTNGMDSIASFNSIIKPTLRIYHPSDSIELEAVKLYNLTKLPLLMDRPDTVKLLVQNIGKHTIVQHDLYLAVQGANTYIDTVTVSNIDPMEYRYVYFASHQPTNLGNDALTATIASDGDPTNNSQQRTREVVYNVYSHYDQSVPSNGGIGFGDTSGDFVAKYYINGTKSINQISVDFSSVNRPFQLGIWNDNGTGGTPGTILYMSDTLRSQRGRFILPIDPVVPVSGGFYVGIRQSTDTFVGFTFQYERPVRPHSFYFAGPANDTNWVNFAPGYDFNFNIEPRMQVANDLMVLDMVSPQTNDTFRYHPTDSLDLQARLVNMGYLDQGLFNVTCEVLNQFNTVVHSSVKTISLDAGDTGLVNFTPLSKYNIGQFTAVVYVDLSTDSVSDNDRVEVDFWLVKDHDVAVDRIFEPANNDTFEINEEGFWPTVRVFNYGVQDQNDLDVFAELVDPQGNVVDSQKQTIDLDAGLSTILTFDSMFLHIDGNHLFRSYTSLAIDSFPVNDTASVNVVGRKSYDLEMRKVVIPLDSSRHAKGSDFKPFIEFRNIGFVSDDSAQFYLNIYNENGQRIYGDTVIRPAPLLSTRQAQFSRFFCDTTGSYTVEAIAYIEKDQLRSNDTMYTTFDVVTAYDLVITELVQPQGVVRQNDSTLHPGVIVRNFGFNDAAQVPLVMQVYNQKNQLVYLDTTVVDLASFKTDTFYFVDEIDLSDAGNFYVDIYHSWSMESSPSANDTLSTQYAIRYGRDISILFHIDPLNGDTLELDESVVPRLQIVNEGLDSIMDIGIEVQFTTTAGGSAYIDTLELDFLAPLSAYNMMADNEWTAVEGEYFFDSRLISDDDNSSNDSYTTSFVVVKRIDASIDVVIFPEQKDELRIDRRYKPVITVLNDGLNSIDDAVVRCVVEAKGTVIYDKFVLIDVAAGEQVDVNLDSSLTHDQVDSALVTWSITALNDQYMQNDTVRYIIYFVDGASVSSLDQQLTRLYPNPNRGDFTLHSQKNMTQVRIVDQHGKLIATLEPNSTQAKLDLNVESGIYMVEVFYDDTVERFSVSIL